ncbi:hypothetical protein M9Y10_021110 [Tritrichomonas musculus]|uniref:Uncharacterized protein n=1 Tax=Tritrichomonas musculus TaxID=1915356 RepID=A0ABR2HEZ7_9EUKA
MTLLFNSTKILDQKSVIGCIQTCNEPDDYENWPNLLKKCSNCDCPLFPLSTEGKNTCDCPICHPKSEFSSKTYRIPLTRENSAETGLAARNHFFFIFDIAMPPKILFNYIQALYESITESDTVSIICITNNVIFATVINGLLVFDVFDNQESVRSLKHYVIRKKDIIDVVLPSISSIYALTPAYLEPISNPFFGLQCILQAISSKNDSDYNSFFINVKFSCMLFFYRSICNLQVSEAETLGESLQETGVIVHFGGPPEFRRFSAVAHYNFGCIFETTSKSTSKIFENLKLNPNENGINPNDAIFDTFNDSDCQPSIIKHLVKLSRPNNKVKLIAPRSVTFIKTTGCAGSVNTKELSAMLDLNAMVGGSVKIQIESNHDNIIHLLEIVKTHPIANSLSIKNDTNSNADTNIHNGFVFLKLHTLRADSGETNRSVTSNILLKGYASDILRAAWDGDDIKKLANSYLTKDIQEIISNTCLSTINEREEAESLKRISPHSPLFSPVSLMQTNVLRLYYVLMNYGKCNLTTQLIERDDCTIIITPPIAYIYKKQLEIRFNLDEFLPGNIWPFSTRIVDDDEFKKLRLFYKVGT